MKDFAGRTAFVTGGSSGLGEGLARALAAEGAKVAIADIVAERAADVAASIVASGGVAIGLGCDVSDRAAVAAAAAETAAKLGRVSLLFSNAGVTALDRLDQSTPQDIDWLLNVNLMGTFHCLEAFLPAMVAARDGQVVATASIVGLIPPLLPTHAPYVASKAGIIGLMLNLRTELAESGVGSTVVCPGGVLGRMIESPMRRPARFGGPSTVEVKFDLDAMDQSDLLFRAPDEAARIVLRGVRTNRAMVLTDGTQRAAFHSYLETVTQAFDDADAYAAETAG